MKKVDIKKLAGAGVLSVGLVFGMAGFAGAQGMIDTTGPYSENEIEHEVDVEMDLDNRNDLDLSNTSTQAASSGATSVMYNTTGGDAMSGDADNASSVSATVSFDNSGSAAAVSDAAAAWGGGGSSTASIENTGPYSDNEVEFESELDVEIDNDNYVDITNSVSQAASSGTATVQYNTTGGDATSGSVSNTSSSSFNVSMTN